MHWGPQTLVGGKDGSADGSKTKNWTDYAVAFTGKKFDAERWAELFKKSGAKYVVQVAEHHDGYALYDSSLSARPPAPWPPVPQPVRRSGLSQAPSVLSWALRRVRWWEPLLAGWPAKWSPKA